MNEVTTRNIVVSNDSCGERQNGHKGERDVMCEVSNLLTHKGSGPGRARGSELYSKGSSDRNRSLGASQPISTG